MQQFVFNAFALGSFYVSFALGLALVFGIMRTINMAHGELFMLGGIALFVLQNSLKAYLDPLATFVIGMFVAFALIGAFGFVLQVSLFRVLRDKPFSILMATLSLSYILQVLVILALGQVVRSIPTPIPGFFRSGSLIVPYQRLTIIAGAFLAIVFLWALLMRTRLGRSIRAVAQDPDGAVLQGISLRRVGAVTMFLGAGLAAVSGVLITSVNAVNPYMGGEALWRAFIVIIVGGVGSIPGAVLASMLFATLDTALTTFGQGHLVTMVDALVMLAVLAFMPNGLMGEKE